MQIGNSIKLVRESRGLSQKELAKQCEITPAALCSIEKGKTSPSRKTMKSICEKLGVTVPFLLFFSLTNSDFKNNEAHIDMSDEMKEVMISRSLSQ